MIGVWERSLPHRSRRHHPRHAAARKEADGENDGRIINRAPHRTSAHTAGEGSWGGDPRNKKRKNAQ